MKRYKELYENPLINGGHDVHRAPADRSRRHADFRGGLAEKDATPGIPITLTGDLKGSPGQIDPPLLKQPFLKTMRSEPAKGWGKFRCGRALRRQWIRGRALRWPSRASRWEGRQIGISELGKVRPVSLHRQGEFPVRFSKREPPPAANGKGIENVRYFETMEGAESRCPFTGHRAVEAIQKRAPADALFEGDFGAYGTGHQHVVTGLIDGAIAVQKNLNQIHGDSAAGPGAIERVSNVCELLHGVARGTLLSGLRGSLGSRGGTNAKGAEFPAVEPRQKVDPSESCPNRKPGRRLRQKPAVDDGAISIEVFVASGHDAARQIGDLWAGISRRVSSDLVCVARAPAAVWPTANPTDSASASVGARPNPNAGPLSAITLRKSPLTKGEVIRTVASMDPADSPKRVTFPGSPPN